VDGRGAPFGYQVQHRKLIIVGSEAEIVRFIFHRYAELGSVRLLKDELQARSIQSKLRVSAISCSGMRSRPSSLVSSRPFRAIPGRGSG
jgi:hypothetical protein